MRFFGTNQPEHRRESQRDPQASARLLLMSRKGVCCPRAAVAFPALSALTWLREQVSGLLGRIMFGRITRGLPKVAADIHKNITLDTQGIE